MVSNTWVVSGPTLLLQVFLGKPQQKCFIINLHISQPPLSLLAEARVNGWGVLLPSLGGASGSVGHTQGALGSLWALSWCPWHRRCPWCCWCHRCHWCPGAGMPQVWQVLGEWWAPWVRKMPLVEGVAPGSHKADGMSGGVVESGSLNRGLSSASEWSPTGIARPV